MCLYWVREHVVICVGLLRHLDVVDERRHRIVEIFGKYVAHKRFNNQLRFQLASGLYGKTRLCLKPDGLKGLVMRRFVSIG